MNKEDIKAYFDLYVLNYQPYKDIPEYQAIIKTLIDFYFDHAYNSINLPFKEAFEQQFIPIEFYEKLLLSIGFPKNIISILTNKDKKILLHSFMDYNRYKGTIEQIRLVGEKFEEDVGIYELFIDLKEIVIPYYKLYTINGQNYFNLENVNLYNKLEPNDIIIINSINYSIVSKSVNDEGYYRVYINKQYVGENLAVEDFTVKRWAFIPEALYIAPNVNKVTEYFDYEKIYQGTKQYFVSAEFLTAKYNNENLVLPIKSNLLFLDYKKYQEINVFNNLLAAIFLKEYYDRRIVITFEETKQYLISLGRLVKLWYYILLKFYNYNLIDSSPINVLTLDITDVNFDYTISDINYLLNGKRDYEGNIVELGYNNLKDLDDFSKFYFDKITSKFTVYGHIPRDISLEEYELLLENEVGVDLIEYLNNRINNSSSEFKQYEYNFILDELYNSLITWSIFESENGVSGKLISNNIGYFLKTLSFISYPISMSPTYNLIMFLKPYHVELIKEITEGVYVKDLGNSAIINADKIQKYYLAFLRSSTLSLSDDILQTIIYNNINNEIESGTLDSTIITHGRIYSLNYLTTSLSKVYADLFELLVIYERESIAQPHSIRADHNIFPIIKSLVFVISNGFSYIHQIINDSNLVSHFNAELINIINTHATNVSDKSYNIIELQDIDASGYVDIDIDIDINVVINDIRNYINEFQILNSPLNTNSLLSHSYNLI